MRNFINALFFTLLTLVLPCASYAAITGSWKMHPTFDNSVIKVIDTPGRVYFMGYNQALNSYLPVLEAPDCSLFFLDKESDEMSDAASRYDMAAQSIRFIEYNPYRKYLLVVYYDNNIDLLFDSGEVHNIAALKNASIPGSKHVNFVSFDRERNLAWIATDFGYLALDDKNYTVKESRNYNRKIEAVASIGDYLFVVADGDIYKAPVNAKRSSIAEFEKEETTPAVIGIYPIDSNKFIIRAYPEAGDNMIMGFRVDKDGEISKIYERQCYHTYDVNPSQDGYNILCRTYTLNFSPKSDSELTASLVNRPEEDTSIRTSSTWDQKEYFTVLPRKGLRSYRHIEGKNYDITRDYSLPDAPSVYLSRGMAYHPRYGMLVQNHGADSAFPDVAVNEPILLSAYKDGFWTRLSPAYRNPEQLKTGNNPLGILIDPQDDKYVWSGSIFSGITRLNLDDPQDILHYSFPGDPTASLPGYVETNPIISSWKQLCYFSPPHLDSKGNLWSFFNNPDDQENIEFRYLTPEDRKASTNASNARPFRKFKTPRKGLTPDYRSSVLHLSSPANQNCIMYIDENDLFIVDHNGTPDNSSDDTSYCFKNFTDQDGGRVALYLSSAIHEDQDSGIVWIGNANGIYYLQPRNLLQGQCIVNRVKVARNDGTELADYLLSGVGVNSIAVDASGRKWLGTIGAGIVVTTSDCRTILMEFTQANSDLLSDNIFFLEYNPSSNSMMISTDKGLCEFYIGGSANNPNVENQVRAFPNPVAPDFYGWVTIDGLPDNSLVKIVDSQGSLVRELGIAEAGSIQWDVNNLHHSRVPTGVYYVLSSSASGGKESSVAKILVMN